MPLAIVTLSCSVRDVYNAHQMPPASSRVFISYSHDSPAHMDRVLELSDRLRKAGIDCQLDQYEESPPDGWSSWCLNQIEESEFVLTVCTETYERRFKGKEKPGQGKGVAFEGFVVTQSIYDAQSKNDKFIPVILSNDNFGHIPVLLRAASFYDISSSDDYEKLYRRLTKQPFITKPGLGPLETLPGRGTTEPVPLLERQRKQDFIGWKMPLAPNPFFTGREKVLDIVRKKLDSSKRVALSGMHGVGKTQVAAEYARRYRDYYQTILWVRAETRETLALDFASIARLLDLPQKDERDQAVIVGAVNRWLERNGGWLLVLDNTEDLSRLREFVPSTHSGHILLTTLAQAFGGFADKVLIDEMSEDEGALLLLRRATLLGKELPLEAAKEVDTKLAREIAGELGGLPLALDQAGAYIEETPSTLAEYRRLYEREGKHLRKERGELSGDHPSVTVTFSLAFNELAKRDPVAADLVRLCAFLAPDAIPEEIFTNGGLALGQEFALRTGNPLDFAATLKHAAQFSLIRRDASDRSLDIHRLVQEVLKDEMDTDRHREWAERAVRAVELSFPEVEFANWIECKRLLPHAKTCAAMIERFSFEFEPAARLLNQTSFYMTRRGQFREAESLCQHALLIYERVLGSQHPSFAISANNLATLYDDQGRYVDAEPLYRQALAVWESAFGPEHQLVATGLNNLAMLYKRQRRYADAEPLYRRALAIDEKALGAAHPGLATDLNNLAGLHREQRQFDLAEPLYRRALVISEEALGQDHPDVATVLGNYAILLRNTGREEEAEPLETRAEAIRKKMREQTATSLALGAS